MAPPDTALALAPPLAAPAPAPVARPSAPRPRRDTGPIMADLHTRHGDELLRFCRWMLKDAEDAADALQDTWIRAMTALAEDRVAVTALRPWLYAIARNVCLDRLRERKRRSLEDFDESAAGETPGADDVLALRQEATAALALVGALSERQRSALLMRELAGMSVPEIASALGVTADRAAWAIGDARRALEEARAGDDLACEDARARLASGHRGRTLRAHLGRCSACLAHDRKLRARRVLAPALVPFVWLKRITWPLFLNPATAATTMAVAVATTAAPHPTPQSWAGNSGPRPDSPAQAWRGAAERPAVADGEAAKAAPRARADRPAVAVTPAAAKKAAAKEKQIAAPAQTPAPAPSTRSPISAPARTVADAVTKTLPEATAPVKRVVTAVTDTVADAVPAAAPAADDVARTATGVLDTLG